MDNNLPVRKRLRKLNFDYNTPGAYFITICTYHKKCTLSRIVGAIHESPAEKHETVGAIHESPAVNSDFIPHLLPYGKIIDEVINHIPEHYPAYVDRYVIMPNHIHFIIVVKDIEDVRRFVNLLYVYIKTIPWMRGRFVNRLYVVDR